MYIETPVKSGVTKLIKKVFFLGGMTIAPLENSFKDTSQSFGFNISSKYSYRSPVKKVYFITRVLVQIYEV